MKPARVGRWDIAGFLLIAGIVVYQSMIPPVVSLANNGDFGKISGHFSIGYPFDLEVRYAPLKFHHDPRFNYHAEFRSSENLIAIAAMGISGVISKTGDFDIRTMGAIHGALFLLAIYLLLPVLAEFFGWRARLAILVLIALVLCDVLYVANFNTFYMDAATLAFFPLGAVFFLRSFIWRRAGDVAGMAISFMLLAGSKPQHAIVAVPLLVLVIGSRRWMNPSAVWVTAAMVLVGAAWTFASAPPYYRSNSWYNVIFLGILPDSRTPAEDLKSLGLNPAYVSYSGTAAYSHDTGLANAEFAREFKDRVHGSTLMRFYIFHPVRTYRLLRHAFGEAGKTRPGYGNFDPAEGLPPLTESKAFALWSDLRTDLFANRGARFLAVTGVLLCLFLLRANARWRLPAVCLGLSLLLEMGVSGLADGMDYSRHFIEFFEIQDIMLLILVASVLPGVGTKEMASGV